MALSQSDLLNVWRRLFPDSYTTPLETEADGRGFDVIASMASVFARVAEAVETTTQAMYILSHSSQTAPPAAGGSKSTGNLTITREAPTDGDIELMDGDPLTVSIMTPDGDTVFEIGLEIDGDATLPLGSTAPMTVSARAAREGYQGNIPDTRGRSVQFLARTTLTITGATTTALNKITDTGIGDRFDEGMIGSFVRFSAGPNVGTVPRRITAVTIGGTTTTITVDGAALVAGVGNTDLEVVDINLLGVNVVLNGDFSGGVIGWLDFLGNERDLQRSGTEADSSYRNRIRELPDIVSPNAVYRAASRILTPLGINFQIFESRGDDVVGAAWDEFPYDDTEADVGLLGRHHFWTGDRFEYQGFYLVIEWLGYGDFGAPWDYPPVPGGVHPSNAWDWMFYDGYAIGFWNDIGMVITEVEKSRMAGVPWLIVFVDSLP